MTIWEDPPEPVPSPRGQAVRIQKLLTELKEHPGKWAILTTGLTRPAAYSRAAQWRRLRGCETRVGHNGDGTTTVYVRWPA